MPHSFSIFSQGNQPGPPNKNQDLLLECQPFNIQAYVHLLYTLEHHQTPLPNKRYRLGSEELRKLPPPPPSIPPPFVQLTPNVEWLMPLNQIETRQRRYSIDQYHTNSPVHPSSRIQKVKTRLPHSPHPLPRHLLKLPMSGGLNR